MFRIFRNFTFIGIVLFIGVWIWFANTSNPYTPAGYMGYLTRGAIFGHAEFVGLQRGPTSPGRGWLLNVINVSITPYTYGEEFTGDNAVLSMDNLKISFRVNIVWKLKADKVKEFVEQYSTIGNSRDPEEIVRVAYVNFIKEPIRTLALDEVQKYKGMDVKDNLINIGDAILKRIREQTGNTPFEVDSVVVGNVQYPPEVADSVSKKLAATQELERKNTEIEITKREKDKRVIEAEGIAQSMEIINQKLNSQYLQYEAIKAQRDMVNSPNHTTIYIPVGPMGVPLVGNLNLSDPNDKTQSMAAPKAPAK